MVSSLMFYLGIASRVTELSVGVGATQVEYRCCSRWAFVCSANNDASEFFLPYSALLSLGVAQENLWWEAGHWQ